MHLERHDGYDESAWRLGGGGVVCFALTASVVWASGGPGGVGGTDGTSNLRLWLRRCWGHGGTAAESDFPPHM